LNGYVNVRRVVCKLLYTIVDLLLSFTNDYTRSITPSTINIGSHPSAAESKGGHNSIRVISVNAHTSIPAGGQNGVTAKVMKLMLGSCTIQEPLPMIEI
jgi:hypothetical protein